MMNEETKNFLEFCLKLKEKYTDNLSSDLFQLELSKDFKSFNFIKKIVFNINYNKKFFQNNSSTESGLTQTPLITTNPTTNILNSSPVSSFKFGCTSKFSKAFSSSVSIPYTPVFAKGLGSSSTSPSVLSPYDCTPISSSSSSPVSTFSFKSLTSTPIFTKGIGSTSPSSIYYKMTNPVLPINPEFSVICSENFSSVTPGIKKFCVNNHDLNKSENFLANKYKLDYLYVCNTLINSELPSLNLNQSISFTNCYFTLEKTENIKTPCEWTAVKGGAGHKVFFINFEKNGDKLQAINVGKDDQDKDKESFKLVIKQYRAKCKNKFIKFQFHLTSGSSSKYLLQFIGTSATQCRCQDKSRKLEIIKNNKNVKTPLLYNKYNSVFASPREIYNIKRKFNESSLLNCSVNKKNNPADHIQELKKKVNSGDNFIRSFSNFNNDLPGFVLYFDHQVLDMFSLILKENILIHVDKTFDLGIYFLTAISFQNKKILTKRSSNYPLFLGPMLLHKKSKNENFEFFFQQLKKKFDELKVKLNCNNNYESKLIFCSDQEKAITNGIQKVFPLSTIVYCYCHLKKSIERTVDSSRLGNMISSLMHLNSLESFQQKVDSIFNSDIFKSLTNLNKKKYIQKEIQTIYLYYLLPKWRLKPDLSITNNIAESSNNKVKRLTGTGINATDLVGYLKVLVENLYGDVEKAFYGDGNFKFANSNYSCDKLNKDQLQTLFNHFISNCNDIALPEVPIKKPRKSSLNKYVNYVNGRPFVQTSDKTESHSAWLFNKAIKPNKGKKKTFTPLKF